MLKLDDTNETYALSFEEMMEMIDKINKSDITEFSFNSEFCEMSIKKESKCVVSQPQTVVQQAPALNVQSVNTQEESVDDSSVYIVKSPIVGTFYASKEEGGEPLVKTGDTVKKDSIVAIIEAMKLMNEITAGADGTITEIMVENGQLVEYGQELMKIKFA